MAPAAKKEESSSSEVERVTMETPAEADKTSAPTALDAKADEPPVRAAMPDTAIAQSLGAGAGEHNPPDNEEFDPQGRPRAVSGSEEQPHNVKE